MPNFVKIVQGICPLGGNFFYQKFEIFTIFSNLSPRFYTHNVKIYLQVNGRTYESINETKFRQNRLRGLPLLHCLPRGGDAYSFLVRYVTQTARF